VVGATLAAIWVLVDMGLRTLRAEELARYVEGLAADNDDLLAIEDLLGDDAGETAKEMALAVDNDLQEAALALHPTRSRTQCGFLVVVVVRNAARRSRSLAVGMASRSAGGGITRTTDSNDDIFPAGFEGRKGKEKEKLISQSNSG
jgi:hypothetical protein